MKTVIHETAVIAPSARLEEGVEVGPYVIVGPNVHIGKGTKLHSHVVIDGHTTVGARCEIFHGAVLGGPPQDKKFKTGGVSYLKVGDDNVIREHVTMHAGGSEGSVTLVGSRGYFMVGTHVGHDCRVGDDVTIANGSALGGHVVVEDKVMIGGVSGIHQHARIGKLAMVGGLTKVSADVPPFSICDGRPARFFGVNSVGLRRAGYTASALNDIKAVLKILFGSRLGLSAAAETVRARYGSNPDVAYILAFSEASKRGLVRRDSEE